MSRLPRILIFVSLATFGSIIFTTSSAGSAEHEGESDLYQSYLGQWQTIDDETNLPRSLVMITVNKGQLSAKITKVYSQEGEPDDPICDKCTGKLKNAKIIGLDILKRMRFEDNVWQDGEILDPKNGKFYDAKIWLEDDQLQVRGYIGFFFRTQQWQRYTIAN